MTVYVHPDDIAKESGITLCQEKSRYLVTVLRSKIGDAIKLIDGRGKAYSAIITSILKNSVILNIEKELSVDTETPFHIALCQGMLKGEKMDTVIQKAVELGLKEVVPLITERSVVKETRRLPRWKKIAEEAAEQCGRAVIPEIKEPADFCDFLSEFSDPDSQCGMIFWEHGGAGLREVVKRVFLNHSSRMKKIFVIVGPEGGFSNKEISDAESAGFVKATLGKRILRAETAAIVSVAATVMMIEELLYQDSDGF